MADELLPEERRLAALRKLIQAQAESDDAQKKALATAREQMEIDKQLADLKNASTDEEKKLKELLEARLVTLKASDAQEQKRIDKARELLAEEDRLEEILEKQTEQRRQQKELLGEINSLATALTGIDFASVASLGGVTSAFIKLGHEVDETRVKLGQATGFTDALNKDMERLAVTSGNLGISIGEAGEIIGSLNNSMTEFAALSPRARAEAASTAAQMSKLGVSVEETGRALDILSRGMGMSTSAANTAGRQFDMLAQQVGLPTSQVVSDFNKVGPQLAKFGKNGTKEFGKLTKQARRLGITIDDAFNIADAFDTFEGAADLAGKLNAQLGLQLNSIELMKASEADRIEIMRREFKMRGQNFDDMGRRQKQAIAEILGTDVDMASRLFGDPVELRKYQKSQEEADKRAEKLTSTMEKFSVTMQNLFLSLQPVVDYFIKFVRYLADSGAAKYILGIVMVVGALAGVVKLLGTAAKITAAVQAGFNVVMGTTAAVAPAAAAGTTAMGTAAAVSAGKILAFGAAIALVGVGIGLAAFGISYLVAEFAKMSAEQIVLTSVALIGLGLAFKAIAVALVPLALSAGAAAGPLLALGGAVALIGVGMGAAAYGVRLLATAFGGLIEKLSVIQMGQFATMAVGIGLLSISLYSLVAAMAAFANPITLVGIGAFALMASQLTGLMSQIGEADKAMDSLDKVITVTTSVSSGQLKDMERVIDQVVRVTGDSSATRATGLDRVASALERFVSQSQPQTARGNNQRSSDMTMVKMELNDKTLGQFVIEQMTNYLDPTAFK